MRSVIKQLLLSNNFDPDALNYIKAVELADRQPLENNVKRAINIFVTGCKSDGIWDAIKASCLLCGARTLLGALIPLKGTAPTNFNFVTGDYNRKTGLKGDGSTKYLNSNRNNNSDPQNSNHNIVYVNTLPIVSSAYLGSGLTDIGTNVLLAASGSHNARNRSGAFVLIATANNGLFGMNRSNSSTVTGRNGGVNYVLALTSEVPHNSNIFVFARNVAGSANTLSDARITFYSIGEALDLALLDTRITTFMNTLNEVL